MVVFFLCYNFGMAKMKSKRKIIIISSIILLFVVYFVLIASQNNWFDVFGRNCKDTYMYGDTPMDHDQLFYMGNPCDPGY